MTDHSRRKVPRVASLVGLVVVGVGAVSVSAHAQQPDAEAQPMSAVIDRVVSGDIVMAANANVRAGDGPGSATAQVSDIDRDESVLCVQRADLAVECADNSSAARLAIPSEARLVQARLYVETTVSADAGPLGVRISGPGWPRDYTFVGQDTPATPMLYEAETELVPDVMMRQTVWDITDYVSDHGGGRYTVADIVSDAARPDQRYASWAVVGVYELDPDVDFDRLSPWRQATFAPRVVSWYDGFVPASYVDADSLADESDPDSSVPDSSVPDSSVPDGSVPDGSVPDGSVPDGSVPDGSVPDGSVPDGSVPDSSVPDEAPTAGEMAVPAGTPFAKSLHIVATGRSADPGNLLFNGRPLGSNLSPGDAPPPTGVWLGDERDCNSTTAVFNDTICVLGRPVVATSAAPVDSDDADADAVDVARAAVDIDVIRVPDHYLAASAPNAALEVFAASDEPVMVGMLALSVDVPQEPADESEETP